MFLKCLVLSRSPSLSPPFSVAVSLALFSSFSLSIPIPLFPHPSFLSLSAWPNRLFMGRNQCKCCEYHSSIPFLLLFPLNHSRCLLSQTPFPRWICLSFAMTCWCALVVYCGCKWQDYTSHHANGQRLRLLGNVVSQPLATTVLTFYPTSLVTSFLPIKCHTQNFALHFISALAASCSTKTIYFFTFPVFCPIFLSWIPSFISVVHGGHNLNPPSAEEAELQRLWNRRSG